MDQTKFKDKKIISLSGFVFIPDLLDLSLMLGNGTLEKTIFPELLLT